MLVGIGGSGGSGGEGQWCVSGAAVVASFLVKLCKLPPSHTWSHPPSTTVLTPYAAQPYPPPPQAPDPVWLSAALSAARPLLPAFEPRDLVSLLSVLAALRRPPPAEWLGEALTVLGARVGALDGQGVAALLKVGPRGAGCSRCAGLRGFGRMPWKQEGACAVPLALGGCRAPHTFGQRAHDAVK